MSPQRFLSCSATGEGVEWCSLCSGPPGCVGCPGWERCCPGRAVPTPLGCPTQPNPTSLCQIDLGDPKKVTGIITQGARDFGHIQYVAAYKVAYSDNGTSWTLYRDSQTNSTKVRGGELRGFGDTSGWAGVARGRFRLVTGCSPPPFPPPRSSTATATTTRTRRTSSTCPSTPASCASCPWPGTTASRCASSCWAATSRGRGRATRGGCPALPAPAHLPLQTSSLPLPLLPPNSEALPFCPGWMGLGLRHCTLRGCRGWDVGMGPALLPRELGTRAPSATRAWL